MQLVKSSFISLSASIRKLFLNGLWKTSTQWVSHCMVLSCKNSFVDTLFCEDVEHTVTVTSDRYVEMRWTFLESNIRDCSIPDMLFQQDGIIEGTSRRSMNASRAIFPGHLLSLRDVIRWFVLWPEIEHCTHFFRGYLKAGVYKYRPGNIKKK